MLTKAQKYLMQQARENHKLADEKIVKLCEEYLNIFLTIPNNPIGLVFEDGVENKNPNYKIDLLTGLMHQIGYWESMRVQSQNLLRFMLLDDSEFERFEAEQEEIKEHNARTIKQLKHELSLRFKDKNNL